MKCKIDHIIPNWKLSLTFKRKAKLWNKAKGFLIWPGFSSSFSLLLCTYAPRCQTSANRFHFPNILCCLTCLCLAWFLCPPCLLDLTLTFCRSSDNHLHDAHQSSLLGVLSTSFYHHHCCRTYHVRLLQGLNKLVTIQHLEQCLVHSKYYICVVFSMPTCLSPPLGGSLLKKSWFLSCTHSTLFMCLQLTQPAPSLVFFLLP